MNPMMKQRILGALVLVSAGMLGSCSSEDLLTGTPNTKWHATGTATMDTEGELTRALSVGGNTGKTLYFNWAGGETLLVRNASGGDAGTMTATVKSGNTAIATIAGEITGTYSVGDKVTYYYPSVEMDLTGQKGTIADLSKNFHYMSAPVTVKAVDADNKAITMGGATFTRRYAVLRLRLTDSDGNRLNVEELKISSTSGHLVKSVTADGTKTYYAANEELTITPDKEDGAYPNEFFIALLNDYDNKDTYSFTAKVGNSVYSSVTDAQKISAKLVENKFYTAVRKLTKTVDGDVETTGDFTFSTISPQTYTGSQITPAVTVYYQGSEVSSSDYELHYFSNTDVGKAFVIAVGKAGTSVADKTGVTTFTINSATISESMLTPIGTQTYTGSPIEPTVTMSGLTQGTDYTVSYANNTNVGTATATITAIGNYTGELEATFTIQKATQSVTLSATSLTIDVGSTGTFTVSRSGDGDITATSSDESIATTSVNQSTGVVTVNKIAAGTATITITVAASDNYEAYAGTALTVSVSSNSLAQATTEDVGKIIGADGKIYATKAAAESANTTAVAMIVYVGDPGTADASSTSYKGLAVALSDFNTNGSAWFGTSNVYSEYSSDCVYRSKTVTDHTSYQDMNGIANTNQMADQTGKCEGHTSHAAASDARNYKYSSSVAAGTVPANCSQWFLPSSGQWMRMLHDTFGITFSNWNQYASGSTTAYTNIKQKFTDAGVGDSMFADDYYWSSSEYNDGYAIYVYFKTPSGNLSGVSVGNYQKNSTLRVRAFLAF